MSAQNVRFVLGLLLLPTSLALIRGWGPRSFDGGKFTGSKSESLLFEHASSSGDVGLANYFWIQSGTSPFEVCVHIASTRAQKRTRLATQSKHGCLHMQMPGAAER
jgi:hypothetical protein